MSAISDTLQNVAAGPKQTTVDGESVSEHSLPDLIQADQYVSEQNASGKRTLPIRLAKVKPGGSV